MCTGSATGGLTNAGRSSRNRFAGVHRQPEDERERQRERRQALLGCALERASELGDDRTERPRAVEEADELGRVRRETGVRPGSDRGSPSCRVSGSHHLGRVVMPHIRMALAFHCCQVI
jgi:hypothetical protein